MTITIYLSPPSSIVSEPILLMISFPLCLVEAWVGCTTYVTYFECLHYMQLMIVLTAMNTEQTYIYRPEWHTGRLSQLVNYFIPPLAFSVHSINISVHSTCNVLILDTSLTTPEPWYHSACTSSTH